MTDVDPVSGALAWRPGRRGRAWHADRSVLVWALLAGALVLLVVAPLTWLVLVSVRDGSTGEFTLASYLVAFGQWRHLRALGNSLVLALCAATVSTGLAVPVAWAVSRTDMPGKRLVQAGMLGAFALPSYLGAAAWILLAGPGTGWLNRAYVGLTGAPSGPFNIYSMPGLVLVVAWGAMPVTFTLVRAALDQIASEIEEAATTLGATVARTTLRVTLPLALPAILGAFTVQILQAIALFGAPALIAVPAGFQVVTTLLWQLLQPPSRMPVAAALSLALLGVGALLVWLRGRVLARTSPRVPREPGGERRLLCLGSWRWVALGYALLVVSLSFALPMLALLQAAFARGWSRGLALDNLTLANLRLVLLDAPATLAATGRTLLYAGGASVIALALALCMTYLVQRELVPLGRALTFLAMTPVIVPGIVLAIGVRAAYADPPLALRGTAWILVLALATRVLPLACAGSRRAMRDIDPELEDAVRVLGGSRLLAVRRVVGPRLERALAGAVLLVAIPATRELGTPILLSTGGTQVLSVLLFNASAEGRVEPLAAIGLVLVALTTALGLLGARLAGRNLPLDPQA